MTKAPPVGRCWSRAMVVSAIAPYSRLRYRMSICSLDAAKTLVYVFRTVPAPAAITRSKFLRQKTFANLIAWNGNKAASTSERRDVSFATRSFPTSYGNAAPADGLAPLYQEGMGPVPLLPSLPVAALPVGITLGIALT